MPPVNARITAQSSSFSWMFRGSPGPGKRAKRVPPVPTPHEGIATPKAATAFTTRVDDHAAARELPAERRVVGLQIAEQWQIALPDVVRVPRVGFKLHTAPISIEFSAGRPPHCRHRR